MLSPALLCRVSAGGHLQLGVGAQVSQLLPTPALSGTHTQERGAHVVLPQHPHSEQLLYHPRELAC